MKQRLIRVLVYEGSPAWIQSCMEHRTVKGNYKPTMMGVQGLIKEAIIGDFLEEVLEREIPPEAEPDEQA